MGYDRDLFVQNIESIQGIKFIRNDIHDGIHAVIFEGLTGHLAIIDTTDLEDDVTEIEGSGILHKLGLSYLIKIFYPLEEVGDIDDEHESTF